MLLFLLPSFFLLVFTTPAPLLRTPNVSEAPQKGRYFVSSAPRPTDPNDAQIRKANYLGIISPQRFLKSLKLHGGNNGPATSPFNSPADYFAQRKYSAYNAPAVPAAPAAAPVYAPAAMSVPVPTVTYHSDAPAYQQTLAAPTPAAAPATYAPQPPAPAVYNVVARPQPVAAGAAPVAALPQAPAPVVAPAPPVAAPAPVFYRPAAPVAAPAPPVYYRNAAAPAPMYAAPATPAAYGPPLFAPRAMSVPVPTVTVAAAPAAAPTMISAAPPAHMPMFDFVPSQPRPLYPSAVMVPPAPLPAVPAARPIYVQPTLHLQQSAPSTPVHYLQGDSSAYVKNPFQISYLPQAAAAVQTVQPTVATAAAPTHQMTVTLRQPMTYLQIQNNGQHGKR